MAFFAGAVYKGAQHVRREAKKNRVRNSIISADGEPNSGGPHIDSLNIENDWWGGDGGSYSPSLVPQDEAPQQPTQDIPPALPPVVSSIDDSTPSAITRKRHPSKARQTSRLTSGAVAGSFLAQLEERREEEKKSSKPSSVSSDDTSSSRCIQQEAMCAANASKKASSRASKKVGAAIPVVPGSFSAQVLNQGIGNTPSINPQMMHRARKGPVSGEGQPVLENGRMNDGGSAQGGAPSHEKPNSSQRKRGTFLEATKTSGKWDEFISRVDNDHHGDGASRKE